jgi:RnfABCDGE-type electron transport complex B subunit
MTAISALLALTLSGQGQMAEAVGYPVGVLAAIGLLLGLGLALAAKKLAVPKDPRVERIEKLLPGANCGGCGAPGCASFAEAVVRGDLPANGCPVSTAAASAEIASILGVEVSGGTRRIALVHCNGGLSATEAFEYHGPQTCAAAHMVMGGQKTCRWGCLGFGDCIAACPFDAIAFGEHGVPVVDMDKCTGCRKCVMVCPKHIIELWPEDRKVVVTCNNRDKGGVARKGCSAACIGCGKCVKACPVEAVKIDTFLARIEPEICINCGLCAAACPTGAIMDRVAARPRAFIDTSCVGCTLCAKVCPVEAITGTLKEKHEVDLEKCIGCGLCVPECPKNSIRMMGALSYSRGENER